jgi:hypothetical protein
MAASRKQIVQEAAARWHVPYWILYGVWGVESGFGANKGPSSAGAEGDFQFIPGTAAEYHVDVHSLASSANGAAHYLHDLFKRFGSWDRALRSYSANGYGLDTVRQKAKESGVNPGDKLSLPPGMAGAGTAKPSAAGAAGSDGALFNSDQRSGAVRALLWVAFVIGGFTLAGMGVRRMVSPSGGGE